MTDQELQGVAAAISVASERTGRTAEWYADLVEKLKAAGVKSFKDGPLEVVFHEGSNRRVDLPKRVTLPADAVLADPVPASE
jgi:hypothetical protein